MLEYIYINICVIADDVCCFVFLFHYYCDMKKCFSNNQPIRHKIGINKIWEGKYDKENNKIIFNGISYKSLSGFAMAHHLKENPSRKTANGWYECECFKNNEWISTNNLENIN